MLQELLELPYIIWTEKPENTIQWSFKPKTWLGKLEDSQDRQRSTSPWLMSMTTPHGFLKVCTCFLWFTFNTLHIHKTILNTCICNIMSLFSWMGIFCFCADFPCLNKSKEITPLIVFWTWWLIVTVFKKYCFSWHYS